MKHRTWLGVSIAVAIVTWSPLLTAENIDPASDDSQYAWAENVGWLNAEPSGNGGPGVQAGDGELSGYLWGENIGWVSLSCDNTLSCATTQYGVTNDGSGVLAGYAWLENVGWISFSCENTSSCGTASYGVTIDPATGDFSGYAWSENAGWISFNCSNTASCGNVDYKVTTGWICDPLPTPPTGIPELTVERDDSDVVLSWNLIAGATGSDIAYGDLDCLRSTAGDFTTCTTGCLDDNRTATSALGPAGNSLFFLVRGQNCGGSGSYDSGGQVQSGLRDAEVLSSGSDCPQ